MLVGSVSLLIKEYRMERENGKEGKMERKGKWKGRENGKEGKMERENGKGKWKEKMKRERKGKGEDGGRGECTFPMRENIKLIIV
jgi:hypothetical protein